MVSGFVILQKWFAIVISIPWSTELVLAATVGRHVKCTNKCECRGSANASQVTLGVGREEHKLLC